MSIQVGFAGNNGYHCNGQKLATAHRGLLLDKCKKTGLCPGDNSRLFSNPRLAILFHEL
jgi:hypothetical protein